MNQTLVLESHQIFLFYSFNLSKDDNKSKSECDFSTGKFLLNVFVEFFKSDCFSVISANSVNDFPKLLFAESIFELFVNVFELFNCKFTSSLKVIKTEVSTSSFFSEWASLKLM